MRNLIFLVWRKRPFLFATVMIATVVLLVLQYQSVTSSNSNRVSSQSTSYGSSFSSANAEPVVGNQYLSNVMDKSEKHLEYRFDGQFRHNSFEKPNSPPKKVSSFVDESKQRVHLAAGDDQSTQPHAKYRIVHFDLKGAPPKLSYLVKILPIIKEAGANGILLEYEDMFPWTGLLEPAKSPVAYSLAEIKQLLQAAASLELEVIPLVQTFGHLEYVLKIKEFRHLREMDQFPAAICPSKNESFDLVVQIIDQVMTVHANKAKWLHIGADEVFQIGQCDLCRVKDREQIYLDHITRVANYVVHKYPGVKPIIWDDMLRNIPSFRLKQLSGLVEPMVWSYVRDIYHFIPYPTWMTFGEAFDNIWAASAFKGAFGETLTVPNIKMHLENNEAWLTVMAEQKEYFKSFRGIAITGWQRYDHLATLCETFAAAFPSLILNLITATNGKFDSNAVLKKFDQVLQCRTSAYQPPFDLDSDPYMWTRAASCLFPGGSLTVFNVAFDIEMWLCCLLIANLSLLSRFGCLPPHSERCTGCQTCR